MATCLEMLTKALRRLSVLGLGDAPDTDQIAEGVEAIQSLYDGLIGEGAFGRMTDVVVTASTYTADEYDRVLAENLSGVTVTMPDTVVDSFTGETRPPKDGAIIVLGDVYSSDRSAFVYDGHVRSWVNVLGLEQGDTAPLSTRYSKGLIAMLAMDLADGYGVTPSKLLTRDAMLGRLALCSRYDGSRQDPEFF